jgi:hypothetical protein
MLGVQDVSLAKDCHAQRQHGSTTQKILLAIKGFILFMVGLAAQGAKLAMSQARHICIATREAYLRWASIVKREAVEFLRGGSSTKIKMVLAKRATS